MPVLPQTVPGGEAGGGGGGPFTNAYYHITSIILKSLAIAWFLYFVYFTLSYSPLR